MKKAYYVDVDVTYSVRTYIEAESEEEAKSLAEERVGKDPLYWIRSNGAVANIEAYDVDDDIIIEAAE